MKNRAGKISMGLIVALMMALALTAGAESVSSQVSIVDMNKPTLIQRHQNTYKLNGTIVSDAPITSVVVEIYDLRALAVERSCEAQMSASQNVRQYKLSQLAGKLSFDRLEPGEKQLNVRVRTQAGETLVASPWFFAFGECAKPANITAQCHFDCTHASEKNLWDNNYDSYWKFQNKDDCIALTIPQDKIAEGFSVEWMEVPKHANVRQYDADGALIREDDETSPQFLVSYYEVDERTRRIEVRSNDIGIKVCEVNVYEQGRISMAVENWEALPEKLDMLVIVAHKNDELLSLGGTMTDAALQGKSVGVVYMTANSRLRYAEGLAGIWTAGVHTYPIFLTYKDEKHQSYERTKEYWGDGALTDLIAIIRQYKPDVIVTHDINGEFGHNQHKLTCALTQEAVELAGDAANEPASAAEFGVWDTPKLYIHLYAENRLELPWNEPREELGGLSIKDWIYVAFEKHWSQRQYSTYSIDGDGKKYDCTCFGLARSTVGPDVEKNSFFENLDDE